VRTADFDYDLPEAAIAQAPSARRDQCRLAAVDRASGEVKHLRFNALPSLLRPHDLLILNDSRVLPARIPCLRASGGAMEIFLLGAPLEDGSWQALLKAGGRLRSAERLKPAKPGANGVFILGEKDEDGRWGVHWEGKHALGAAALARIGLPPLPPYIRRAKVPDREVELKDRRWYQTVFAKHTGSVAAPTAGLHFTPGLLERCRAAGARIATVTLHVSAGTFLPVKTERLEEHPMHAERCELPLATAHAIARCRQAGGRVIAVGTTALRTLESAVIDGGEGATGAQAAFRQGWFETRLFLKPGDRFKVVDALVTNFHQPRSTLLPLVAAFWSREQILALYQSCLERGYRFLSYGDACFFY
jgi:S-adenosylmethionine:tRNA ribosyltransferase-isomerase